MFYRVKHCHGHIILFIVKFNKNDLQKIEREREREIHTCRIVCPLTNTCTSDARFCASSHSLISAMSSGCQKEIADLPVSHQYRSTCIRLPQSHTYTHNHNSLQKCITYTQRCGLNFVKFI